MPFPLADWSDSLSEIEDDNYFDLFLPWVYASELAMIAWESQLVDYVPSLDVLTCNVPDASIGELVSISGKITESIIGGHRGNPIIIANRHIDFHKDINSIEFIFNEWSTAIEAKEIEDEYLASFETGE